MLNRAEQWTGLPPQQREEVRERIARWQLMTPQERQQTRENRRQFEQLPPEQRAKLHAAFERFQQLPPQQREQLIKQWHAIPPTKRLQWMQQTGHDRAPPPAEHGRP